jgi:hypothetical protein
VEIQKAAMIGGKRLRLSKAAERTVPVNSADHVVDAVAVRGKAITGEVRL